MDDNEKYGIEFNAQIGKGFSSTISKIKREIGKIPEERMLRYSAKTNFKHLDKEMKNSLKTFENLQKKMTGKNFLGMNSPGKHLANYLFGDKNRYKEIDKAFEKIKLRAIQAREEQYKSLKNLMGTTDIEDNHSTDDSLMGQTAKAYAEQSQAILDLKDRLAELNADTMAMCLEPGYKNVTQIRVDNILEARKSLELHMGSNVKDRKDYIMNNFDKVGGYYAN